MKAHWRKARVQEGDDFSLVDLKQFPLAGFVVGPGENLPSSSWDCKIETLLCWESKVLSSCWGLCFLYSFAQKHSLLI